MPKVTTEVTPNPAAMRFVLDEFIFRSGESLLFSSKKEAHGYSSLAEELFNFPFVSGVFIAANFITVTIRSSMSWDLLREEMRAYIYEFVVTGKSIVSKLPDRDSEEINQAMDLEANSLDETLKQLLEEHIRPLVERDGGRIDYVGFDKGKVYIELKGACSGCPGAASTLKFGVENKLKEHLPEVLEVVAVNF